MADRSKMRTAGFPRPPASRCLLALVAVALTACGSSSDTTTTTARPPVSRETADHLSKLSSRIADDLDAGDTCSAAHAADDLKAAVEDSDLPGSIRPGVDTVAGDLVDQVNCPPPPPPPEPEKKPKKPTSQDEGGDHGRRRARERRTGTGTGTARRGRSATAASPHHGGFVPPGRRKAQGGGGMNRTLAGERYELEDRLGHGGMATVYRAHDLKLDREVAIKLLADNLAGDDEVRKRFSREARLAARLDHPNVVQVFDVGEDEDRPFIVMEHVEGGTLEDRMNRRRRSGPRRGPPPSRPALRGARPRSREEARPPRHQAAEPAAARLRRLPEDHRFRDRARRRGNHPSDAAGQGGRDRPLHGAGAAGRRPDHSRHRRLRMRGGCERAAARSSLTRAARDHRPLPPRRPRSSASAMRASWARPWRRWRGTARSEWSAGSSRRAAPPSGSPPVRRRPTGRPRPPRRRGGARPPRSALDRGRAAVGCGGCGHGDRHRLGRFGFAGKRQAGAPGRPGAGCGAALGRPRDSGEAAGGLPPRPVPAGRGRARTQP